MNTPISINKHIISFGAPLLIIGLMVFIAKSPIFALHPDQLAIGITFDLLLTVPLVYFILIRKTTIPNTTVVPILIFGTIVCSIILPPQNQQYLSLFKAWGLPIVELSLMSYVIYHVLKAAKRFKKKKQAQFDFFTTLKNTCHEILPKGVVMPVVTEIAVFYYGFLFWNKRILKKNEFSYHKDSGTIAILITVMGLVIAETFVFHLLLVKWSNAAAWTLSFLSIYSGIQIFGFLKSMLKRPIAISGRTLYLRYGIMSEATIGLEDIDTVEISSKGIEPTDEVLKLSPLGDLESHNIIIRLKKENTVTGLYGIKRKCKALALHIDNKVDFKNHLDHAIQNNDKKQ